MSNNQTPTTPGGPLSFKTVPGRHRTQKWNTAPKNTYDGDDWGDYDPYDDYGGGEEEPAPPLPAQSSALPSQRLRKQSFDRGDDGAGSRAVSAPFPSYQQGPASGGRASNDYPRSRSRPRDFTNPEQAPPPLNAQREAAPAPPGFFPPRKSSMGGNTYEGQQEAAEARAIAESITHPAVNTGAATTASAETNKPLPFIRPSDIYKRMDEEKRRESEESGRPSTDALDRVTSAERQSDLTPVQEHRESVLYPHTYQPHVKERSGNEQTLSDVQSTSSTISGTRGASPTLPLVSRFSGFGDEILTLTSPRGTEDASLPSRSSPPGLNTAGLGGTTTASSSIQPTPTSTRAAPGSDPAAEILAERQQDDGLQHQPSVGFRSAVHQAFDQNDATLSRDNSGSTPSTGVGRSDTSSTAGISPIMSRVPSAATAAFNQRQRDGQVPPIAEESSTASQPVSGSNAAGLGGAQTKPSPGHSGSIGTEQTSAAFEPGYRRSLDPPSSGTSPARTPALETVEPRRLSTPLAGVIGADEPDVVDQGAEVVQPELHSAETPASEVGELGSASAVSAAVPITGRGRSNTDYSVREADIANTINSSPDKDPGSPELAEAAQESKDSREMFLRTHNMPSSSPVRSGTPTRSDSPAKSRVREIAEKYQDIDRDSRRNSAASIGSSKSGWSTFTDDANKPKLKKSATNQSLLAQEVAPAEQATQGLGVSRPEPGREDSSRLDMPGGWINSAAPTPAVEAPPELSTRSAPAEDEPVDLTPTTKKYQLQGVQPTTTSRSPIDAAKDMGSQLGAALMGQYGVGHQTRDFGSKEAAAPVDQPETLPRRAYGDVQPAPPLLRYETDSSAAPTSVASSVAPTPLPKDTPEPPTPTNAGGVLNAGYFNTVAPLRVRSREPSPEHDSTPPAAQHLSHVSGDSAEDDRIREEIVRSLDADDNVRTQDAVNAPDNERRIEHGDSAFPAAAAGAVGLGAAAATVAAAAHSKTTPTKPGLLNTRFSWENSTTPSREEPKSPEIKPEAAYERPRSKQLHIMNPEDGAMSPDTPVVERELPVLSGTAGGPLSVPAVGRPEAAAAEGEIVRSLSQRVKSPISPLTKSQEHLIPETTIGPGSPSRSLRDVAPSPISDRSPRIPSYYADSNQETIHAPSTTAERNSSTVAATSPSRPKSSGQTQGQIPAFRNILQIKDADERIKTYNDTRRTFADMNTGLGDWLEAMTARHPDVLDAAELGKPPPLEPSVSATASNQWKRGHRAAAPSMNLAGITKRFASGSSAQGSSQGRTASTGGNAPGGLASSDTAGGSGGIDMDRVQQQVQQKSKEFMKNAGVFGNKAGAGAKGLLAKGRSRFGGSVRGKGGEV